jgi:hypothetical protein
VLAFGLAHVGSQLCEKMEGMLPLSMQGRGRLAGSMDGYAGWRWRFVFRLLPRIVKEGPLVGGISWCCCVLSLVRDQRESWEKSLRAPLTPSRRGQFPSCFAPFRAKGETLDPECWIGQQRHHDVVLLLGGVAFVAREVQS